MDIVAKVTGTLWDTAGRVVDLWWRLASGHAALGWIGVVLASCAALSIAGHLDRRIERGRFHITLRLHGYRSHGEYVGGPEWKARRRRWLSETGKRPCHICGKPWRDGPSGVGYHAHHVDYFRAGSGHESNRDLVPICHECHTLVHKVDRYRGPFGTRALGLSLRRCTGLVRAAYWPVRALRGDAGIVYGPTPRRASRRPRQRQGIRPAEVHPLGGSDHHRAGDHRAGNVDPHRHQTGTGRP